jgi:hypothetical protein
MVLWELWRDGHAMRCEVRAHPDGHEVRLSDDRGTVAPQVFATLEAAQREADARRDALLAPGWSTLRLVSARSAR